MTDYATFKALPAQERDDLGFAKWRENQHIGTHEPGCWKYGRNHYECAVAEIEALQSRVQELGQIARENRSIKVVELESEVERLRKDEREACAVMCDQQAESHELSSNTQAAKGCDDCATAIRARGSNVT